MKNIRTIRDAINAGSKEIHCVNGTIIKLPDIGQGDWGIQPPKYINGKPVYRWLFCQIQSNRNTVGLEDIANRKMGNPFMPDEYCIPEREMNMFISQNRGISEYGTMFWVNQWDDTETIDKMLDRLCTALENI